MEIEHKELFKVPFRDKMFGSYWEYFDKAMDALNMKQTAIANNIANAQNANYHPVHVDFNNMLQKFLDVRLYGSPYAGSDDLSITLDFDPEFEVEGDTHSLKPTVTRDKVAHVDVNREMAELAKTQLLYGFSVDMTKLGWGKYVIESMTK